MGNQPSAPSAPSTPPPPPPPPVPPPCDLECQRQNQLASLKIALDTATQNRATDPEAYEQARIAYFTLLNGQGWLNQEKRRIAKNEIEPLVSKYRSEYEALKGEQKTQSMFKNLEDALKAQEIADEQTGGFLKKQLQAEKDKALIADRLNALGAPQSSTTNWLGIAMDILITVLGLVVLYLGFTKLGSIVSLFGSQSQDVESIV